MQCNPEKTSPKRNNFLINPQNDLRVLKISVKFTRWMGITPFSLKANSFQRIFTKCLVSTLVTVYVVSECVNSRLQIRYDEKELGAENDLYIPMKILWYLSNSLFLIVCVVRPNMFQLRHWKRFFTALDKVEESMREFEFRMTRNSFLIFSETFTATGFTIIVHIFHLTYLVLVGRSHKILSYLGWSASHIYMVSTLSLLRLLARTLEKRFIHLDDMLSGLKDDNSKDGVLEVAKILRAYKKLFSVTDGTNAVFGLQMLLCVMITFIFTVSYLSYTLLFSQTEYCPFTYLTLLWACMYLVSSIICLVCIFIYFHSSNVEYFGNIQVKINSRKLIQNHPVRMRILMVYDVRALVNRSIYYIMIIKELLHINVNDLC